MTTILECPICGGTLVYLGNLGKYTHFRCQACGALQETSALCTHPHTTERSQCCSVPFIWEIEGFCSRCGDHTGVEVVCDVCDEVLE